MEMLLLDVAHGKILEMALERREKRGDMTLLPWPEKSTR